MLIYSRPTHEWFELEQIQIICISCLDFFCFTLIFTLEQLKISKICSLAQPIKFKIFFILTVIYIIVSLEPPCLQLITTSTHERQKSQEWSKKILYNRPRNIRNAQILQKLIIKFLNTNLNFCRTSFSLDIIII